MPLGFNVGAGGKQGVPSEANTCNQADVSTDLEFTGWQHASRDQHDIGIRDGVRIIGDGVDSLERYGAGAFLSSQASGHGSRVDQGAQPLQG